MFGEVSGHGHMEWPDGSVYDGEVLCGRRHGTGIYRCKRTGAVYDGEWVRGKREGQGAICLLYTSDAADE